MKNFISLSLSVPAVLLALPAMAQVHVDGYYRSNGTYVKPYERTAPDSTRTNNYNYPGNYNPNSGRVTGGDSFGSPSKSYPSRNSY